VRGRHPSPLTGRWLVRAGATLARHPGLWGTGIRQALTLAPAGWWRRAPFLPVPDPAYLHFRLQTAYGDPARSPEPADLVTYLHWCRAWPRVAR
jgi:hypothetical protein